MNLVEHGKRELELAGYDLNPKLIEDDPASRIARCTLELLEVISKQKHTPVSINFTLRLLNQLASYKALTELTDNKDEWEYAGKIENVNFYQSYRQPGCFTSDFKEYFDIKDPENSNYEKDENNQLTGYATLKPLNERKRVKLKHV